MPPKPTSKPSPTKKPAGSTLRERHVGQPASQDQPTVSPLSRSRAAPSTPARGAGSPKDSFWRRLRYLIFAREDFDDDFETPVYYRPQQQQQSPNARSPLNRGGGGEGGGEPRTPMQGDVVYGPVNVPRWQRRTVQILERTGLPQSVQRVLFDTVDFFTRRRVYVVLMVAMIAFVAAFWVHIDDTVNFVRETFVTEEEDRPGIGFLDRFNDGKPLEGKHPVVIMPGFITGALELWESNLTCMEAHRSLFGGFRMRMFGPQMIYLILSDPNCWLELFSMNRTTGLDVDGVRVRADTGFSSIDYFVPGYWVWAKVLVNLGDIGYDPQSITVAAYDWRVSPAVTHKRDGFFYRVRNDAKFMCQKNRRAAVFISHSYGTTVALAFLKWTEEREPGWMNKYVAYYVNVGGTALGLPKAFSASLMGDVRDTLTIPRPVRRILDTWLSQSARYNVTRTWSCLTAMLPRGCDEAFPNLMVMPNGTRLTLRQAYGALRDEAVQSGHLDLVRQLDEQLEEVDELPVLPTAPDTTVVCLYGVNERAEEGYYVVREEGGLVSNMSYTDAEKEVLQGVQLANGDGTVSLNSLAYMCRAPNGWQRNVGRVVTIETDQQKLDNPLSLRGGSRGANHVDILGNFGMIETLLRIASGLVDNYNTRVLQQNREMEANGIDVSEQKHESERDVHASKADDEKSVHPSPVDPDVMEEAEAMQADAESVSGGSPFKLDDYIVSNIDELIRTQMYKCTLKKNNPIQPRNWRQDDDNEFIETP